MIDQKRLDAAFERWWRHEGSAPPEAGVDWAEHCRNIAEAAWDSGAFVAQRQAMEVFSLDDFELRGLLAKELQCWHRLSGKEAQNLMDFVRYRMSALAPQPAPQPTKADGGAA